MIDDYLYVYLAGPEGGAAGQHSEGRRLRQ